jgi:hypothetical protein
VPEQAAEAGVVEGVVEGGHLQKCLKTRRTPKVSLADVIGAGLFIGGWQFRSHRRRAIGPSVPSNRHLSAHSGRTCWGCSSHE